MNDYRLAALLVAGALAGCGGGQPRAPGASAEEQPAATASLVDSTGARVGVATFSDSGGSGRLAIRDMARTGLVLNLVSTALIVAIGHWLLPAVFAFARP